jgi:hypothetical protein
VFDAGPENTARKAPLLESLSWASPRLPIAILEFAFYEMKNIFFVPLIVLMIKKCATQSQNELHYLFWSFDILIWVFGISWYIETLGV